MVPEARAADTPAGFVRLLEPRLDISHASLNGVALSVTLHMFDKDGAGSFSIAMATDAIGYQPQSFPLVHEQGVFIDTPDVADMSAVQGRGLWSRGIVSAVPSLISASHNASAVAKDRPSVFMESNCAG